MRTALVTGGNRGIGLEVCRQLARRGVAVLLGSRDPGLGEEAARSLAGEGLVEAVDLDVADAASIETCARLLARRGVRVDILVNNAAVMCRGDALSVADVDLLESLQVNLLGAWRCCRAFLPAMAAAGWGRVVNVSSGWGPSPRVLADPPPTASPRPPSTPSR